MLWVLNFFKRYEWCNYNLYESSTLKRDRQLMAWRHKEPRHQQTWYWHSLPRIVHHIVKAQAIEILPCERWRHNCITQSIPWLLMAWRCIEPGHQQTWYWHSLPRIVHHIVKAQAIEILPCERWRHNCITQSIPWLLMAWRCIEPGHQQTWYWHSLPRIVHHMVKAQAIEILPCERWRHNCITQSIPWLLMAWRCIEPGHQQTWYWHSLPRIVHHIVKAQAIEILPCERWRHNCITQSIPWLLMAWRCIEPGHQQTWYWHSLPRIVHHIVKAQAIEILPCERWRHNCITQSIPWLLMAWRCIEPGHQQTWYWPSLHRAIWSLHVKGYWISQLNLAVDLFRGNLTHWGWVTHICTVKLTIIGSDNGLVPGWRQAIIGTNAGILLIGPLATNFSEILIEIQTFSLKKIHLKMLSAKCCPFHLGLSRLRARACLQYAVSIVFADALAMWRHDIDLVCRE